jgi:hypothetical protein
MPGAKPGRRRKAAFGLNKVAAMDKVAPVNKVAAVDKVAAKG